MKFPDWIKSALIAELEIIHSKLDGTDRASDIDALIHVIHNCEGAWVNSEKLTNTDLDPVDGQVFLAKAIMLALNYKRMAVEEWDKDVISQTHRLIELLRIPIDENLKAECGSAVEKLQLIIDPIVEKIENRHHGKKEAFWVKRRQGDDASRMYFIQHLCFAYFRRDNEDKHCSDVAQISNGTKLFKEIDGRGVRRICEDIKGIESGYTANLSLAYAITPDVTPTNK